MVKRIKSNNKKKNLKRLTFYNRSMKKEVKRNKLMDSILDAQKDPEFIRDINKFIKATMQIHKLY